MPGFFTQAPAPPTALQKPPAPPDLQNEVKKDNAVQTSVNHAKPGDATPATGLGPTNPSLDANAPDAPEFALTDAAGYTTTLDTYKGRLFLFGVITRDQKTAVAGLQQIYNSLGKNRGIRIIGVSRREENFDGVTFPVYYNHGSKLLGVPDGEFLFLDSAGSKILQGSLSDPVDLARLRMQVSRRDSK
jgi:hypothetical protein